MLQPGSLSEQGLWPMVEAWDTPGKMFSRTTTVSEVMLEFQIRVLVLGKVK